jgi:hypothetical protein
MMIPIYMFPFDHDTFLYLDYGLILYSIPSKIFIKHLAQPIQC